jgi:Dam-replacing HTH domain
LIVKARHVEGAHARRRLATSARFFAWEFPNNRFIDAKIRQSLQVLRDQGVLRFVSPGHYQRLDVPPVFSPLIDMAVASRFVSAAQATRVALETWASFNLYCLNWA